MAEKQAHGGNFIPGGILMKSIGLFHGSIKKKKKARKGSQWVIWTIPLPLDKIPWVPAAPMVHPSSLSWCLIGLTVREDLL